MSVVTGMLKAIYAAVTAALSGVAAALVGAHTFASVTDGQWVTVAALTVAAFAAVYGVTNTTAPAAPVQPAAVPPPPPLTHA